MQVFKRDLQISPLESFWHSAGRPPICESGSDEYLFCEFYFFFLNFISSSFRLVKPITYPSKAMEAMECILKAWSSQY